jgi:hypothetical protein
VRGTGIFCLTANSEITNLEITNLEITNSAITNHQFNRQLKKICTISFAKTQNFFLIAERGAKVVT